MNHIVSRPLAIKRKTLFLHIELSAFSNRGHSYGHFEKKNYSNISKINEMVRKISQFNKKTTVLKYDCLKFLDSNHQVNNEVE